MATEVHPVACTEMLSQFLYTFAYRITVAKISRFQASNAHTQLGLRLFVAQRLKPVGERFLAAFGLIAEDFNHLDNVA